MKVKSNFLLTMTLLLVLVFSISTINAEIQGKIIKVMDEGVKDSVSDNFEDSKAKFTFSNDEVYEEVINSNGEYSFNPKNIYCWKDCNIFPNIYLDDLSISEEGNRLAIVNIPFSNALQEDRQNMGLSTSIFTSNRVDADAPKKSPFINNDLVLNLPINKTKQEGIGYSVFWQGILIIPEEKIYNFYVNVSGEYLLLIDNQTINEEKDNNKKSIYPKKLSAGNHTLEIKYYTLENYSNPNLYWNNEIIPKENLIFIYGGSKRVGQIKMMSFSASEFSMSSTTYPSGTWYYYNTKNTAKRPVLLVHGWSNKQVSSDDYWGDMSWDLEDEGLEILELVYNPANLGNKKNAGMFYAVMSSIRSSYPAFTKIDVVAHSMGALLTRGYIQDLGISQDGNPRYYQDDIRKLILIAGPMYGTYRANQINDAYNFPIICDTINLILNKNVVSDATKDMEIGSDFTWELNSQQLDTSIDYLTVGGFHSYIVCLYNNNQIEDGLVPMMSTNLLKYNMPHITLDRVHTTINDNPQIEGVVDDFINSRGTNAIKENLDYNGEYYIDPDDTNADYQHYQNKGGVLISFSNKDVVTETKLYKNPTWYTLTKNPRTKRWFYLNWAGFNQYSNELSTGTYDVYYNDGTGLKDSGKEVVIEQDAVTLLTINNIIDSDSDGVADSIDNCPSTYNPNQANNDGDSQGDVCDSDDDNDGFLDVNDACPIVYGIDCHGCPMPTCQFGYSANCPVSGAPTCLITDTDNDGISDTSDNCKFVYNPNQANNDGDSLGDVCDSDDDNDGFLDVNDACQFVYGTCHGCQMPDCYKNYTDPYCPIDATPYCGPREPSPNGFISLSTVSSKININDTLRQVRIVLTKYELPNILNDGNFSGNVNASYVQYIELGSNPSLIFGKQPSSSNDPSFGFATSTSTNNVIYNASITFNKAINFIDSKGKNISFFGKNFIISSLTDNINLVLMDESKKMILTSGSAVIYDNNAIDGTLVTITGGIGAMTKMVIGVASKDSDHDAILPGASFIDPVFGTFKVDFSGGMSITDASDDAKRESFEIRNSGDDKMSVKFKNHKGNEATVVFAKNTTHSLQLTYDDDVKNITVVEKERVFKNGYVVVGNQDEGYLLRVSSLTNSSAYSNDKVVLSDVFDSSSTYTATLTAEGVGTITIGGKVYNIYSNVTNTDTDNVVIDYPDSSAAGSIVLYPTIKTSKGALIAFYEPLTINLVDVDGRLDTVTAASQLRFPDGDGYTDFTTTHLTGAGNWTIGTQTINTTDPIEAGNANLTVGKLIFTAVSTAVSNSTKIYLRDPATPQTLIRDPALIIFEEKDDASNYEAIVVTLEPGTTSTDGIGISDVIRTWGADSVWDSITLASKSTQSKEADLYGTIALVDSGDSDQTTALISYPDEQIYAQIYIGNELNIICYNNSDCGSSGFIGNNFCSQDTVLGNYINFTCNSPSTSQSYCTNITTLQLINICATGTCSYTNNYCKNNAVYRGKNCTVAGCFSGTCTINGSSFSEEIVQNCSAKQICSNAQCICSTNLTNTTWGGWKNVSNICSIRDGVNQSRFRVQYDSNNCGNISNKTTYEYRELNNSCDYCNYSIKTISTQWQNDSCQITDIMKQKRTNITYDVNYSFCYSVTNLPRDLWNNGQNITIEEFKEIEQNTCNYCSENISQPIYTEWSICSDGLRTRTKYLIDYNYGSCCAITNLDSDCEIKTIYQNVTETTSEGCPSNNQTNTSTNFLSINNPSPGVYDNGRLSINLNSNITFSKIDFVDYSENRPRQTNLCRNCNKYNKVRSFSDGEHNLTFIGIMTDGKNITNQTFFLIDTKDPRISKTEPRSNKYTNGSDFYIKYYEENCQNLKILINEQEILSQNCISGKNIEKIIPLDISSFNGQLVRYQFIISDIAGNTDKSSLTKIEVDTISPEIKNLNVSVSGRYAYFKMNVLNENKDSFDKVEYKDNSESRPRWKTLCTSLKNGVCEKRVYLRTGNHNVIVRALDEAGNSDTQSLSLTI